MELTEGGMAPEQRPAGEEGVEAAPVKCLLTLLPEPESVGPVQINAASYRCQHTFPPISSSPRSQQIHLWIKTPDIVIGWNLVSMETKDKLWYIKPRKFDDDDDGDDDDDNIIFSQNLRQDAILSSYFSTSLPLEHASSQIGV